MPDPTQGKRGRKIHAVPGSNAAFHRRLDGSCPLENLRECFQDWGVQGLQELQVESYLTLALALALALTLALTPHSSSSLLTLHPHPHPRPSP